MPLTLSLTRVPPSPPRMQGEGAVLLPRPGCGERVGARGIALSREAETPGPREKALPEQIERVHDLRSDAEGAQSHTEARPDLGRGYVEDPDPAIVSDGCTDLTIRLHRGGVQIVQPRLWTGEFSEQPVLRVL